ncbi:PREDICTED: lipase maturation factor 1-like [Priapulus caudatus]|uniref:Lipase maturation factor n=1 Tax=Priapulus caudatus TaxID=37621 RepID=A0ABM1E614_PRICU|nr:PREDICTED: lipase maturation factor 1-like [Priapulus caudatus]
MAQRSSNRWSSFCQAGKSACLRKIGGDAETSYKKVVYVSLSSAPLSIASLFFAARLVKDLKGLMMIVKACKFLAAHDTADPIRSVVARVAVSRVADSKVGDSRSAGIARLPESQGENHLFFYTLVVAFIIAYSQNTALIGNDGLLPANTYLQTLKASAKSDPMKMFTSAPTLLWFMDWESDIDRCLEYISLAGIVLASVVTLTGAANMVVMVALWMLYHSIVNVGQRWYSFGWESQLLETGFLAIWFCPLLSWRQLPRKTPPSLLVVWGHRWLIFRIMLGAGLIKIRGDDCWTKLTCMNYHYETQPVPNPLSYYLHRSPIYIHNLEVAGNHIIELIAPWFIIMGRRMCAINGFLQIFFQVVLILSGNLSFLNWLTILPSICCFDDSHLTFLFGSSTKNQVAQLQQDVKSSMTAHHGRGLRRVVEVCVGVALVYLSVPVIANLASAKQAMNTSFDPLRIVNTYGAFGSITKERTEVILQGTYDEDPLSASATWEEYEFKCKPGNLSQRPCVISPYHYRLDWLMWFAAFQNYQYNPWLVHLTAKLLVNDQLVTSLMAHNPFMGSDPPRYIRAEHYVYEYTHPDSKEAQAGNWYKRSYRSTYMPPVDLEKLAPGLRHLGWPVPDTPEKYINKGADSATPEQQAREAAGGKIPNKATKQTSGGPNPSKEAKQAAESQKLKEQAKQAAESLKLKEQAKQEAESQKLKEQAKQAADSQKLKEQAKQAADSQKLKEQAKQVADSQKLKEQAKQAAESQKLKEQAKQATESQKLKEQVKQAAESQKLKEQAKQAADSQKLKEQAKQAAESQKLKEQAKQAADSQKLKEQAKQAAESQKLKEQAKQEAESLKLKEQAKQAAESQK